MELTQKQKQKIEELKKYVRKRDIESAHVSYDRIIRKIAENHEPELVKQLNEIVKDIIFWYA